MKDFVTDENLDFTFHFSTSFWKSLLFIELTTTFFGEVMKKLKQGVSVQRNVAALAKKKKAEKRGGACLESETSLNTSDYEPDH